MSDYKQHEPMLEMFIFETSQLVGQLEQLIIQSEKDATYAENTINEIFRIMHTIKGSSAMMLYNNISTLAHSIEDLFFFIREKKPTQLDYSSLSDLIFEGIDFIKLEIQKIKNSDDADGNSLALIEKNKEYVSSIRDANDLATEEMPSHQSNSKQQYYISQDKPILPNSTNTYKAIIYFKDGCEMENIRAYTVLHHLNEITTEYKSYPEDIVENDHTVEIIRRDGFTIILKSDRTYQEMYEFFLKTIFLRDLELIELERDEEVFSIPGQVCSTKTIVLEDSPINIAQLEIKQSSEDKAVDKEVMVASSSHQSIISVNVDKLDKLMDLVGELVISEAMVTQNPDLKTLELENFQKAARQLRKISSEIQDMVMSIRMVPLETTFHKMNRIVRDMSKKLGKGVKLVISGEDTEVDKNIIEHISDPLMHLIRNSIDHGIESPQERLSKGKPETGVITLEAKNAGSDVIVLVKDDGKGLNKERILERARENGLIHKTENEMTDKEVYALIFLPGFSTRDKVTEFSGRGVGMDVVTRNIEMVGGTVTIDSQQDVGTTITLKIPLTLAIIDGMNIGVGNSRYTLPTIAIKQSFRPQEQELITDPDGNEMIMVRGQCHPILRLHRYFNVQTKITNISKGIIVMVENNEDTLCLFADELLGEQQVVVKTLPSYIKSTRKIGGLAGCTLLGDGSISLILDVGGLINRERAS